MAWTDTAGFLLSVILNLCEFCEFLVLLFIPHYNHHMKNDLLKKMKTAVQKLRTGQGDSIELFHHNDTDGLSSGTILSTALEREGFTVNRYSLEKPYPQVLERILKSEGRVIILTDFAGKIAPLISGLNRGRNLVLIIDHHPAEPASDDRVLNLDGDLFGLKGDRDISASATCYLFAKVLNEKNLDLAHLGALGAVGDGFYVNGALSGINREVMLEAVDAGLMRFEQRDFGEEYFIRLDGEYPADLLCGALDTLGGVGYYEGGTDQGVALCRDGFNPSLRERIDTLQHMQREIFDREIENLRQGGLISTEHLQWFDVADRFRPMGVKMIGVFCNTIKNMDFLDPTKYLAGFQTVPDEVPGFGVIEFHSKKISMRVSDYLTTEIRGDRSPGLSSFLPEATLNIGGFADACHGLSAATTVKIGQEIELIEEIEKVLKNKEA